VSAPERVHFGIAHIAAWRGGDAALAERLQSIGWELPPLGRAWFGPQRIAVCVQPHRWLLLDESRSVDFTARCLEAVADTGAVVELTAARSAWRLRGANARKHLIEGCRLDLAPAAFPVGQAAATTIAQVHATIVAEPDGWLLLCSASVTEHFDGWLQHITDTARGHA
jgi:sarcosine oxidase subunit gamma